LPTSWREDQCQDRMLIRRRTRHSELARRRIGEPERVAYGPSEIEQLDIYRAAGAAAPIFVFIHGGSYPDAVPPLRNTDHAIEQWASF